MNYMRKKVDFYRGIKRQRYAYGSEEMRLAVAAVARDSGHTEGSSPADLALLRIMAGVNETASGFPPIEPALHHLTANSGYSGVREMTKQEVWKIAISDTELLLLANAGYPGVGSGMPVLRPKQIMENERVGDETGPDFTWDGVALTPLDFAVQHQLFTLNANGKPTVELGYPDDYDFSAVPRYAVGLLGFAPVPGIGPAFARQRQGFQYWMSSFVDGADIWNYSSVADYFPPYGDNQDWLTAFGWNMYLFDALTAISFAIGNISRTSLIPMIYNNYSNATNDVPNMYVNYSTGTDNFNYWSRHEAPWSSNASQRPQYHRPGGYDLVRYLGSGADLGLHQFLGTTGNVSFTGLGDRIGGRYALLNIHPDEAALVTIGTFVTPQSRESYRAAALYSDLSDTESAIGIGVNLPTTEYFESGKNLCSYLVGRECDTQPITDPDPQTLCGVCLTQEEVELFFAEQCDCIVWPGIPQNTEPAEGTSSTLHTVEEGIYFQQSPVTGAYYNLQVPHDAPPDASDGFPWLVIEIVVPIAIIIAVRESLCILLYFMI